MRTNIYKDKIIKLLKKKHLLSIFDIHKHISDADYSTVYRNIEKLENDGEIKKVVFDKDKVLYEIKDNDRHHDHFVCTDCGLVDEIDSKSLKSDSLKKYLVTDVLVKGLCNKCY